MSLRLKLAILNSLVVLLALGTGMWLLVSQAQRAYLGSIDRELFQRASRFPGPNIRPEGGPGEPPFGQGVGDPNQRPNQPRFGGPGDMGRPHIYGENGDAIREEDNPPLDPRALKAPADGPIFSFTQIDGRKIRVVTAKVQRPNFVGKVQFAADLGEFDRMSQNQMSTVWVLLPVSLVVSAILGWLMASFATRPINRMKEAASRISPQNLSERLEGYGQDEVGELASSFNTMLERLELSSLEREKLMDSLRESLEQQKRFVSDASHELRTPLTRIRLASSSIEEQDLTLEETKESLTMIDKEAVGMTELVEQLLALARLESGTSLQIETLPVRSLFEQLRDEFGRDPRVKWIPAPSDLTIRCHEPSVLRALRNLIENARKYTQEGGEISVEANQSPSGVQIRISDNGSGIATEHLSRLTERFYRVDDSRNRAIGGTGLGLAIVKGIMDQHHGEVQVQSRVGAGTAVTLTFPQ